MRKIVQLGFIIITILSCKNRNIAIVMDRAVKKDTITEKTIINKYKRYSLEGNIRPMKKLLYDHKNVSDSIKELSKKFENRFVKKLESFKTSGNQFVDNVLRIYRAYWVRVLMMEEESSEGFKNLKNELSSLLISSGYQESNKPIQQIKSILNDKGYHILTGRTFPYQEMMIWKDQVEKKYQIQLTDTIQEMNLVVLNDFVSKGWLSFSSFGYNASAGWATNNQLFIVAPQYNLDSESFYISYLKHEARHLIDKKLFNLGTTELEYRAKLTELIYADKTSIKLLNKFIIEGNKTSKSPHGKANYRLISNLSKQLFNKKHETDLNKWREIDKEKIQMTARNLLLQNTLKMKR